MSWQDWWTFVQFHLSLSLLAVGGAVTLAPGLHRFLVLDHRWLTEVQFSQALVLAQSAPGPNVLYIALLGWQVGLGAAGAHAIGWVSAGLGLIGMLIALTAVLLPSSCLTLLTARWCNKHQEWLGIQAFKQGMAPIVIGTLLSSAWLLVKGDGQFAHSGGRWLVSCVCAALVWRTRLHLLWMLAAGAVAGGAGLI